MSAPGFTIRDYRPGDEPGAYRVCLETGDNGADGTPFYTDDPDALARIFVGPYLAFEPEFALILEDGEGQVAGYALAAPDTKAFQRRYESEWRPRLEAEFPEPTGDPASWTRTQAVHWLYHHPEHWLPDDYEAYPSHLHIDLSPHAQGVGLGREMMEILLDRLAACGSPGVHLGMSVVNERALRFYERLGFREIARTGVQDDGTLWMARRLPR